MVRPNLEYVFCDWCPQIGTHQYRKESIKNNFLLFALWGLNCSRLLLINLPFLTNRIMTLGVIFLHHLFNGNVDRQHV